LLRDADRDLQAKVETLDQPALCDPCQSQRRVCWGGLVLEVCMILVGGTKVASVLVARRIPGIDLGRQHGVGGKVNRVFEFVGEIGEALLHLGGTESGSVVDCRYRLNGFLS